MTATGLPANNAGAMTASVRRYWGVVNARWELPFLLRLPPNAFLCWEPQEGVATLASLAKVGAIQWRRSTSLLTAKQAFDASFEVADEPPEALPARDYRMAAVIDGQRYLAAQITGGEAGGFEEVEAYSVANVFICLRSREEFAIDSMMSRVAAALNNVIDAQSLLIADGRTRTLRPELDSYYTTFSLATVSDAWPQMTAEALLLRLDELIFGSELGRTRIQQVGIGSAADLTVRPFAPEVLDTWMAAVRNELPVDAHQRLMLSALRRLSRREHFLAVIDAEAAVEVCVAELIRRVMRRRGVADGEIDSLFDNTIVRLQQQIVYLDKLAHTLDAARPRFDNSEVQRRWKSRLADVRHDIVHRGLRTVPETVAVAAVAAGIETMIYLEQMAPEVLSGVRSGAEFARLENVRPTAGKLFRLFDA